MTRGRSLRKVSFPSGFTLYEGDQLLARERLPFGGGNHTIESGDVFSITRIEYAEGDVQIALEDAALDYIAYDALDEHLGRGEIVLTDAKE